MTPPSDRIAIVTDSSCDLPQSVVEELGIRVVPLLLIMGERTWRDGVDIDPPAFYELLRTSPVFPSSAQPQPDDFQRVFEELAQDHSGIVAVLVSSGLSGTVNSALIAASNLPDLPIEIVDSGAVSMQLGLTVLAAARSAAVGESLETVATIAREYAASAHILFVVDTLEYLHRGGRIGAAAKLFGSALNLKPVLAVQDGIVTPIARIRTRRKALGELSRLVGEHVKPGDRCQMSVLHIDAPEDAAAMAQSLQGQYEPEDLLVVECGPVIGTHAGPGTVGVAVHVSDAS